MKYPFFLNLLNLALRKRKASLNLKLKDCARNPALWCFWCTTKHISAFHHRRLICSCEAPLDFWNCNFKTLGKLLRSLFLRISLFADISHLQNNCFSLSNLKDHRQKCNYPIWLFELKKKYAGGFLCDSKALCNLIYLTSKTRAHSFCNWK